MITLFLVLYHENNTKGILHNEISSIVQEVGKT